MKKILIGILALLLLGAVGMTTAGAAEQDFAPDGADSYPSVVSITPGVNGFTIRWSAYSGAAQYRLFVRRSGSWVRVGDTAATSMNHTGLADRTSYTYTVRAMNRAGSYISGYSAAGWSKTYRAAPTLTSVVPSGNALKLSWKALSGINSYRVYRRNGSAWQGVAFVTGASYTDTNVTSGSTYTYTVRGVNDAHTEFLSAYSDGGIAARFCAMPTITRAESLNGVVRLQWNAAAGASRYRVFYRSDAGWRAIGDTAATAFDYRTTETGVTRCYTVRAMDDSGAYISDFSRTGRTHKHLSTPVLTAVENAAAGQKLTWQPVAGAERYRVYTLSGGAWKKAADYDGTSCTVTGLTNETAYTYTVRCVSADGKALQSGFDRTGMSRYYIEAPQVTAFTNLTTGALITWNAPEEVSRYRVFVRTEKGWQRLGDVKGNCCLHAEAADGETYTYTVRAIDREGNYTSGYDTAGFTNTYYATPSFGKVVPAPGITDLRWQARADVAGYRIYRRGFGEGWRRMDSVVRASYIDVDAPDDALYQYTLRYLDADGNPVSDYRVDNPYYYNGALADGTITVNGHELLFKDGAYVSGYVSAQDIVRIAEKEVGTRATYYKNCKYNTWYYGAEVSGEGYDWCAVFVNWVFNEAGAYDLLCSTSANCGQMGWDFKQNGMLITSGYRVGDVVFFHWDDSPSSYLPEMKTLDHVGIIVGVNDDGSYTTVEGNTGASRDGEVMIQTRYARQISCGGRPKYGYVTPAPKAKSGIAATGALAERIPGAPAGGEYRLREQGQMDGSL